MKIIPVNAGKKFVVVDDEDFEWLNDLTGWWINTTGHVQLRKEHKGKNITHLMSRLIMLPEREEYVLHRNGNLLDFQRANLEVVSRSESRQRSSIKAERVKNAKHYSPVDNYFQVHVRRGGHERYAYAPNEEQAKIKAKQLLEEVSKLPPA